MGDRSPHDSSDEPWLLSSFVDDTQDYGTEAQLPTAVGDASRPDRLADEQGGDEHARHSPADSAVAANQTNHVVRSVLGAREGGGHGIARARVDRGGRSLSERFVGALLVVVLPKQVEDSLLCAQVATRRLRGFCGQCPMHSLVATILLRVSRFDALGSDTELDPPDCERGQTSRSTAGKRRSVVGADPAGNPELHEGSLEVLANVGLVRDAQALALDQETACCIADRQGVTALAIEQSKVALEVGAPDVVGGHAGP